ESRGIRRAARRGRTSRGGHDRREQGCPGRPSGRCRLIPYGQVSKAAVSWTGWKAVNWWLKYCRLAAVTVSVTLIVVRTLVKPPAKNQKRSLKPQAFRTLVTTSTLPLSKNQK